MWFPCQLWGGHGEGGCTTMPHQPPPVNPTVPAQGMLGTPDACGRGHRGETVSPRALGSPLLPDPGKQGL